MVRHPYSPQGFADSSTAARHHGFMAENPYQELLDRMRQRAVLSGAMGILSWDQEVMMPTGGLAQRARELSLLAALTHERLVDPRLKELLDRAEDLEQLPDGASANLREIRRSVERATRLPTELVAEIAETRSLAQNAWTESRKDSDFDRFRPWLEKLVGLMQRKAECLGSESGEAWDALAEGFEPGMRAADLQVLFAPLRERLSTLVQELAEVPTDRAPDDDIDRRKLPRSEQEAFVRHVAGQLGFDFSRGRLDVSTHPFTGGSHCGDVRITTRFREDFILDALGSTMHEVGHGLYEQGLSPAHVGTPLGEAVSLGIHESQSRLWENQVGRSLPFWHWCRDMLPRFFGAGLSGFTAERLFHSANRVQPSPIRVEADEATYNLHIMVRFDLELALIRGELPPADLPAAWNESYRDYLGIEIPDDRRGCLQDVHWSCGLFGYFPTYTLGNLYAAQFFAQAEADIPDLPEQFARGEFSPLKQWLNQNIHCKGQLHRAAELCRTVTGSPLSPAPYLEYLETKLRGVYGV
jgi:carboxypeptidase Taq